MSIDIALQMERAGLDAPELPLRIGTERPVRFGAKKRCWYWLREIRARSGAFVTVGAFGRWGSTGGTWRVEVDWKGIGDDERAQLQAQQAAARQADAERRRAKARRAELSADVRWREAAPRGASPYAARKLIHEPEACRFEPDGTLLVPLVRYGATPAESALVGLQAIAADGTKRFTYGFDKRGAAVRLGHVVVGEPILVCEGWATGMTIRMALGRRLPVFVALDAGNLLPVCELLRELHPEARLLICADDDWRTEGNPGRHHAKAAAREVGACDFTWPVFPAALRGPKDTDFNDLHAACGLHVVARQLNAALYATRQWRTDRRRA